MRHLRILALLAICASAAAFADDYRELSAAHEIAAGQSLYVEFHSGDLEIEAGTANKVEIELEIECEWRRHDCEELLDDIDVRWRSSERRLRLEVEGLASWRRARVTVDAILRMPATTPLTVEMAAGQLTVDGLANDVRVDMAAGDVRIWVAEAAVEGVAIDVGVGEAKFRGANAYVTGRRKMLIGSEVRWDDGPGKARIDVELGVGEATVWLE